MVLVQPANFTEMTAEQLLHDLKMKVTQSCPTLCYPMDYTVHGILQARILEWISCSLLQGIFLIQGLNPDLPHCSLIIYQLNHQGCPRIASVQFSSVTQSCPTLCDPMNYTVHGILQARILEWVAFPLSGGSSQPRDWTQISHIAGGFLTRWAARL